MTSNEPTWTQGKVLKEGPKPAKVPCLPRLAVTLVAIAALATGVVIR